jgi:small-conductance mechanosensitive channel
VSSRTGKILLAVAGTLAVVIAWRLFSPLAAPRVEESLGAEASRLWNKPFFVAGELAVTPSFLLKSFLYLVILLVATHLIRRIVRRALARTSLDPGLAYALDKAAAYGFFSIGAIIALQSAGLDLSTLTVLGGALGVGVGFGLQNITKNFASGVVLLAERPVNIGDRIEVGGLEGDIVEIGGRSTRVRTNENVLIIVPNSEFVEQRVTNLSLTDPRVRISVPLGVSYGTDPDQVVRILETIAEDHPDVLEEPPPRVIFGGFGDSSLDFELWVWTVNQMRTARVMRSELYFSIFAAFKEQGIEIPYPQRDLHLRSSDVEVGTTGKPTDMRAEEREPEPGSVQRGREEG